MERTGKCMCGAATFTAKGVNAEGSACHCGMCLSWAGGPWMGVFVQSIDWHTKDTVATIQSSKWAERGFCNKCGSSLFYRLTADGKFKGVTSVSLGILDDSSGITLTKEWFIDKKPDAYSLEGDRKKITEAEAFAMFAGG